MCGIAGAVGAVDAEIAAAVRKMMDAQVHRGPDDSGLFQSDGQPGVVFGFRRLSILDLSPVGHQPMVDQERGNVIVFNGELYNYAELRRELEQAGETFRSKGDTEVLLKTLGSLGAPGLNRLRGMFGFAFYDKRANSVLVARDRLGIKPLYYAELSRPGGKVVLFASELRALLATGLFERRIDPTGLATYLWNGFVVGTHTLVQGISLLPPGSLLRLDVGQPKPRAGKWWSFARVEKLPEAEALARLERELLTAAEQHLASDVPLGVFLSGGVDSSAVTSLAVRAGSRKVRTFHIGFEEARFDESAYARRVAESLGTEHAELRLTQQRFVDGLDDALSSLDQPTFDAINTYFVSRTVRDAGFTVALAGTGGDELFGGYKSFRELPLGRHVARALRPAPERVLERASRLVTRLKAPPSGDVPAQTRWGKLGDLLLTRGDPLGLYQVAYGLYTREFLSELGRPGLSSLAPHGLPEETRRELEVAVSGASALDKVSVLELSMFIGERLLRDTDAASMAASLEVRVPLLDHRVVEALRAVPDQARFQPLGKKALLKRLAMPELDPEIFDRPKAGFVMPIELWAKDRLADQIATTFADRALTESVGLDGGALGRLLRAFREGAPGIYWSRVWSPFVLLRWCQHHGMALG